MEQQEHPFMKIQLCAVHFKVPAATAYTLYISSD